MFDNRTEEQWIALANKARKEGDSVRARKYNIFAEIAANNGTLRIPAYKNSKGQIIKGQMIETKGGPAYKPADKTLKLIYVDNAKANGFTAIEVIAPVKLNHTNDTVYPDMSKTWKKAA